MRMFFIGCDDDDDDDGGVVVVQCADAVVSGADAVVAVLSCQRCTWQQLWFSSQTGVGAVEVNTVSAYVQLCMKVCLWPYYHVCHMKDTFAASVSCCAVSACTDHGEHALRDRSSA